MALDQQDLKTTLEEIPRSAVVAVPDAEGASLTTFVRGAPGVVDADNTWARELDELQYEKREGRCLDAARTGNMFGMRELASEGRSPAGGPSRAARASASLAEPNN